MKLPQLNRWRFGLKTLFIVVTLAAVTLGLHEQIFFLVIMPFVLLGHGLTGQSWLGFSSLWLFTWYLEQIHKTLGNSAGTRWVLPAKWATLLLTLGATRANLTIHQFPNDFTDGWAFYSYVVGFFLLRTWMPRRAFLGERVASPRLISIANWSLGLAWILGPLSLLALIIRSQFEFKGLDGLGYAIWVYLLNCLAGVFAAIYLAIKVYEDHFSWPLCLSVLYLGLWWALLVAG